MKYAYKHSCGETAFFFVERPVEFMPVRSEHTQLLDGSTPAPYSKIVCGACGEWIRELLSVENIVEMD